MATASDLLALEEKILELIAAGSGNKQIDKIVKQVQAETEPYAAASFIEKKIRNMSDDDVPLVIIGDKDVCFVTQDGLEALGLLESLEDDVPIYEEMMHTVLGILADTWENAKTPEQQSMTYQGLLAKVRAAYPREQAKSLTARILNHLIVEEEVFLLQDESFKTLDIKFVIGEEGLKDYFITEEQLEVFGQD